MLAKLEYFNPAGGIKSRAALAMIEQAESVAPEEVEAFCDAMLKIAEEAESDPELVKTAPHETPVRRVDEVRAARNLKVRWEPEDQGS